MMPGQMPQNAAPPPPGYMPEMPPGYSNDQDGSQLTEEQKQEKGKSNYLFVHYSLIVNYFDLF